MPPLPDQIQQRPGHPPSPRRASNGRWQDALLDPVGRPIHAVPVTAVAGRRSRALHPGHRQNEPLDVGLLERVTRLYLSEI